VIQKLNSIQSYPNTPGLLEELIGKVNELVEEANKNDLPILNKDDPKILEDINKVETISNKLMMSHY
jgi:hypothetical protein